MNIGSHGDSASSPKGKGKIRYRESSDSEDDGVAPSDECKDLLGALEYSLETEASNLNYTSGADGVPKRGCSDADIETVTLKIELDCGKAEEVGFRFRCWKVLEQENNRWIEENLQKDIDLVDQNEMPMETAEPSDDLITPLLRYQKEWLAWASKQEESPARGGILADEMGMGKTLQAIALVLFRRSISTGTPDPNSPSSSVCFPGELPQIKGTLVICPVVAVMQWAREIDRFTLKGSTKVLVYHGAKRAQNLDQLSGYDFVITTYSIVETEYRNYVNNKSPRKEPKQQRKKPKFEVHNKNVGGCKEVENDNSIETSDATGQTSSEEKSILHCADWERIVLDEAHCIRDIRKKTTKAVLALRSRYKWALSGTPLQNRVGDLYSLIRFLQLFPFSYFFCKHCNCSILDVSYSSSGGCPGCGHSTVDHFCWWKSYVSKPIQDFGTNTGAGRGAMNFLKHKILKCSMLRRTKKGRAADLVLPPKVVTLRIDSLYADEEDYYTALYNKSQAQFNTYVEAGTLMSNFARIFVLLLRLRQALDHPYLVEFSRNSMKGKGKAVDTRSNIKCYVCNDSEEDTVVTSCGHTFCKPCLFGISACSKPLTVDFSTNKDGKEQRSKKTIEGFRPSSILNTIPLEDFQTSTKIEALREEIRLMIERDGSAKAIVFSQFLAFLDLIHYALQKSGVNCVHLDGSTSMGARDTAVKKFTEDPSCRVILMSLKAGGVALNLTVASHVFMMDPWWNPGMEWQAQDRIHRIGQYKPIRIVKFIVENTVEERILKLQEKKQLVFAGTLDDGSSEALEELTEDDLKFLFAT
ncbi:DNA repair protein RAD16-like [Salvia divinorum]|uniref:DNA repair protein RAD16-like n=1 Tax=Salvia divinorum TaxID=28513 RepID=A0ABD1HJN6_SALDI